MEVQLRDYQKAMIGAIYGCIKAGKKKLVGIAVMGAGKTITAAWMMRDCTARGKKAVFLVHLQVLIPQTVETLRRLGVWATVLQGNHQYDPNATAIVASVQTINSRLKKQTPHELLGDNIGLICLDEAHVTAFDKCWPLLTEAYPDAVFLGLTATPWRLSRKEWLGQKFDEAIVALQPPDVIAAGGAVPCRGYTVGGVLDLDVVGTTAGDYSEGDMAKQATRPEAMAHVVDQYQKIAGTEKFMLVGSTVEQALAQAEVFNAAGIPCETITGETPAEERQAIFQRVRDGETIGISSVGCLTAGFDLPCLTTILYVRATKSKALFQQVAGRGSRPFPGKTHYKLLDFGGNLPRFGNPMAYQDYSIAEDPRPPKEAPTKECPECNAVVLAFARVCPECGYMFPAKEEEEEPTLLYEDLGEYLDKYDRKKVKFLRLARKKAWEKRLNPDLPYEQFHSEFHHNPPADWSMNACLGKRYSRVRAGQFLEWLRQHQKPGKFADRWLSHHLALEFGTDMPQVEMWWSVLGVEPSATKQECIEAYQARYQAAVGLYSPDMLETYAVELNAALSLSQKSYWFQAVPA